MHKLQHDLIQVLDAQESKRSIDPTTGFLTIKDCVLAGVGVLPYPSNKVFADSTEDKTVFVLRDKDAYSDEFITKSTGHDITFTHQFVDAVDATKKSVGVVINPVFDGAQFKADLLIKDKQVIDELEKPESKGKYSLSVGIYSQIQDFNDTIDGQEVVAKQTNLVFNHVAIVTNPRYKSAKISDEAEKTEPTTELQQEPVKFSDDIEAEIERRANEKATKLADERVQLLSKVTKAFADYDGTSKTGREVMIDVVNKAKVYKYEQFAHIYSGCFGDISPVLLTDEALNIMFNVALTVVSCGAVKLEPTEVTIVTPVEGVQVTVATVEDSEESKNKAIGLVKTIDSASNYISPRDEFINRFKGIN